MPNLDPWINQYDDENDQITKEAYSKYENYLLSVKAKFQRILEKNLPYQHPNYVESYQKTIEMIDWTLIRYRMILPIENN
jgi:hypothetical protein